MRGLRSAAVAALACLTAAVAAAAPAAAFSLDRLTPREAAAPLPGFLAPEGRGRTARVAGPAAAANGVRARLGPTEPTRQVIEAGSEVPAGAIVIDIEERHLTLGTGEGRAIRYRVGVGADSVSLRGEAVVGDKQTWPSWRPTAAMRERNPNLPLFVSSGVHNPLGARALYLHRDGRDTLFRIHGTNEDWSIGQSVSSGCIRMLNDDVVDLFDRVPVGARVIVR